MTDQSQSPEISSSDSGDGTMQSDEQDSDGKYSGVLRQMGVSALLSLSALTLTTQTALAQNGTDGITEAPAEICDTQLVGVVDTAMTLILGVGWLFPAMAAGAFFLLAGTTSNMEKTQNYKSNAKNSMFAIFALLGFSIFIDLFVTLFDGIELIGCIDVFPF